MSGIRQRVLHQRILEAIERYPALQERFPLRQVALHAVAAEDKARAHLYGMPALDELARGAPSAEALTFAQRLHDLLAPTASSETRLQLARALGHLHESLGQLEAAQTWRARQLEGAGERGEPAELAAAHFDVSELALVRSDYHSAIAAAKEGLNIITDAEAPQSELASRGFRLLGASLAMEGDDLAAAERYLEQAAAISREADDATNLSAILFELGNVEAQRGAITQALVRYEEAGRQAEMAHASYYQALAYNNYAYHSLLLGQSDSAERAATHGLRVAEAHELVSVLVHLYSTLGEIRLYQADWDQATDYFERGLALAEELGNQERRAGHLAGQALAAHGAGRLDQARSLLERALALVPESGYAHLRARIELWLAETVRDCGDYDAARHILTHALTTALTQERSLLVIQGERVVATLLAAEGDWVSASVSFNRSIRRAEDLVLPLEVARTRLAWAQAIMRAETPAPKTRAMARAWLSDARRVFVESHARADLLSLDQSTLTGAY
jgi:tetratricopeptide (TPR) repeat protein